MAVLTEPHPTLFAVPMRGLAVFFGLLNCVQATMSESAFYGSSQFAFGLLLLLAAVAPLKRAVPVFVYAAVTIAFVRIRALADETAIPVHYDYPIAFEKALFGDVLNVWLQDLLYVPGSIGALDAFLAGVYFSYFLAPAAMSLLLWKIRPALFARFAWALILTLTIGLVVYFAVPTAPPWLAAETGQLGTVHRVIPPFTAMLAGDAYEQAAATFDQNAVAAMPSLHVALTVVIAGVMAQFGRAWRGLGIAYVAAMCLALVYLGEHYVIDEIAGIALGAGAWQATGAVTRRSQEHGVSGQAGELPEQSAETGPGWQRAA